MIILGIETSCDETALALIEAESNSVRVLANITHSQAALHAKYGGVFPNLAKREHSRNLIPLLKTVLEESGFGNFKSQFPISKQILNSKSEKLKAVSYKLAAILEREPELLTQFLEFIPTIEKPPIDAVVVTFGPGLEPALWVGLNFAQALGAVWNTPIVPVNHMEGHIISALLRRDENSKLETPRLPSGGQVNSKQVLNSKLQVPNTTRYTLHTIRFPAIALLISGGHTELVLIKKLHKYEIIGETKDDAVGEAFDKVARILGLPYPGGPEISALAEQARNTSSLNTKRFTLNTIHLPRPMLHSGDYNFSFSGLKTAVLYTARKIPRPTAKIKMELAREFEDSVTEVLISKTTKAIKEFEAKTLIIAGGVIANKHIRSAFEELRASAFPSLELLIPEISHSTDNALMIAVAGYLNLQNGKRQEQIKGQEIIAAGRAKLQSKQELS